MGLPLHLHCPPLPYFCFPVLSYQVAFNTSSYYCKGVLPYEKALD